MASMPRITKPRRADAREDIAIELTDAVLARE
jgi:hypothetical protein